MNKLKIFIIAGEASGDVLGGNLIAELKKLRKISLYGVGGTSLKKKGLKSLFPMEELSIMGFVEIIPHIPNILKRINECCAEIIKLQPDLVITIDSPDFNFRVVKKLKKSAQLKNTKFVHYIAPTVWAYREYRAKKIAAFYDLLLAILPFEPPYFTKYGLPTIFIGNPIIDKISTIKHIDFRRKYKIPAEKKLIIMTLGSRANEVARLAPIYKGVIAELKKTHKKLHIVLPTITNLKPLIEDFAKTLKVKTTIINDEVDKFSAFKQADLAIAKSGTNTMEMASYDMPMLICYKTNPVTYAIGSRIVKVKYGNLLNIMADKEIIPEFVQGKATVKNISYSANLLLTTRKIAKQQVATRHKILEKFSNREKVNASAKAASDIIKIL
jgi:lipid-A-disaccharide synthase